MFDVLGNDQGFGVGKLKYIKPTREKRSSPTSDNSPGHLKLIELPKKRAGTRNLDGITSEPLGNPTF